MLRCCANPALQATFWLASHYRLVENRSIFTRKLFENAANMSGIEGRPAFGPDPAAWTREERDVAWAHLAFWRRMKGTGKSVAIAALAPVGRHRGVIHPVVVANLHLLASRERAEQRALQAAVIVKYCRYAASKLGEAAGAPAALVVCGDFNSGTALYRPDTPSQLKPFVRAVAEAGEATSSSAELATAAMHAAACAATFQPRSLQLQAGADGDDETPVAVAAAAAASAGGGTAGAAAADAIETAMTAAGARTRASAGVYELMQHGYLGRHHPHHPFQFYQQCARLGLGESSFSAMHSSTVLSFQLPFAFTSAYSAVCGVEAPWTNMHAHRKREWGTGTCVHGGSVLSTDRAHHLRASLHSSPLQTPSITSSLPAAKPSATRLPLRPRCHLSCKRPTRTAAPWLRRPLMRQQLQGCRWVRHSWALMARFIGLSQQPMAVATVWQLPQSATRRPPMPLLSSRPRPRAQTLRHGGRALLSSCQ